MDDKEKSEKKHIFDSHKNVLRVVYGLFVACALLALVDIIFLTGAVDKHAQYQMEETPGFYAIFGFVACVILVLVSKYILRPIVMRKETYYDDE